MIPQFENTQGIDAGLLPIQRELENSLSWLTWAFGKSQRLVKSINNRQFYYPAVYKALCEYVDVSPNSDLGNFCFFDILDPITISDDIDFAPRYTVNFGLVFWFNFEMIYADSERNLEEIKNDILRVLRNFPNMHIDSIYERAENIYKGYSLKEVDTQFLMQPYAGLRFEGTLELDEECIIPPPAPIYYDVTYIHSDPSGSIIAPELVVTVNSADPYTIASFPEELLPFVPDNFEFNNWNTQQDGEGENYAPNIEIQVRHDIALYSTWRQVSVPNMLRDTRDPNPANPIWKAHGIASHGGYTSDNFGIIVMSSDGEVEFWQPVNIVKGEHYTISCRLALICDQPENIIPCISGDKPLRFTIDGDEQQIVGNIIENFPNDGKYHDVTLTIEADKTYNGSIFLTGIITNYGSTANYWARAALMMVPGDTAMQWAPHIDEV